MKLKSWFISVGVVIAVVAIGIGFAYPLIKPKKVLKVYQPADINPLLVDESLQGVRRDHKIADFKLVNQLGDTVTNATFAGKIYVANFFFATCPTICPIMSSNFEKLQSEYEDEPMVMFLSHSVTPNLDSVPVLREYGEKYHADPKKWILATGDKKEIYNLARKSYFAVLDEGDGGKQDFIHTENLILIDTHRRIRGYYDGTSDKAVKRLSEDIKVLLREEKGEDS